MPTPSAALDTMTSPDFERSTPPDWLCTRFALRVVSVLGHKFNLRRDINDVLSVTAMHYVWPVPVLHRLQKYLAVRCVEFAHWRGVAELDPAAFLEKYGSYNGNTDDATLYYYLDEFAKQHAKDMFAVFDATAEAIDARLKKHPLLLNKNIAMLAKVLGLSKVESTVLLHASLCKYKRDLRTVLVDCKVASSQEAYQLLATVFSDNSHANASDIAAALKTGGRMEALGLVEAPYAEHNITDLGDLLRVTDKLLPILMAQYKNEAQMMAVFTKPAQATHLTAHDYPHLEADVRILTALLHNAAAQNEKGINVLLYGPPGTGKTELAKLVAQQAACELYQVDCTDNEGNSLTGKDRYRSLQVSQAFLRGRHNTVLLFDEVEDVFPASSGEMLSNFISEENKTSVNGKAWVNQTLESNPVPTVWISNSIGQIDAAYLRRFQFHLEVANPPRAVRESIVRKYLGGLDVSKEFVSELASRKSLTPAQIQSAARFVDLTHSTLHDSIESLINAQLSRADKALGNRGDNDGMRPSITQYSLDFLNVESRHPIEKIVTSLQAKKRGTLCFYGLPGTGKTALGEYIAKQMERPLLIKRASDLMSKYVGETEQKMAAMFEEAKVERAILLLDEADSFLQNRQMAQRSWEVTEVNEMLQQMERFDGVFICTTNLFERIDEAALRRFSFKIKFLPLNEKQRETMFINEALQGNQKSMTDALRARLHKLRLLTPGDFAVVKRQNNLIDEPLNADDFVAQLEMEHGMKPDVKFERNIGFVH